MKRYLLTILCSMLAYSTIYASFPVNQNIQMEVNDGEIWSASLDDSPEGSPYGTASFVLGILWFPLLIVAAVVGIAGEVEDSEEWETSAIALLIAAIVSFVMAPITGIISLARKEGSIWKPIVGISLTLGIILVSIISSALESY